MTSHFENHSAIRMGFLRTRGEQEISKLATFRERTNNFLRFSSEFGDMMMLVFALSLAMIASLVTATAVAVHNEADKSRVKIAAKTRRILR
ncbi:hypothetical protein [Aureimonas sp. AU20]|uniref:hypothetical protein n=1 Tax=Aureimonas sp. AU20 TaxID=1349819 RepID=UPI0011DFE0B0|nr:hypothetical protein [Aureimonas sp. AU20]